MPLPTKRQKQLLDYIRRFIESHGYSPSYEEMSQHLNVSSPATIFDHLRQLGQKGLIKVYKGAVRGIEVVEASFAARPVDLQVELPLLGYIAAGQPLEVITRAETVVISSSLISGKKPAFVLKVKGDSMIDEGIFDGDYVVVEQQNTANDGDIVVALVDENFATLKKFYREKDRVKLVPANAKMKPIYAKNVAIQGKVKAIIRRF